MSKSVVQPLEKEIEAYFVRRVKAAGGWAIKFQSAGNSGVPDRIVFWPDGSIEFVELKRPGEKPRPLQINVCKKISSYGNSVFVIDSKEKVDLYTTDALEPRFRDGVDLEGG